MRYVAVVFCTDCNLLLSELPPNEPDECQASGRESCFGNRHGEESPPFRTMREAEDWAETRTAEIPLWDYHIIEMHDGDNVAWRLPA